MFEKLVCTKFLLPLIRSKIDPSQFAFVSGVSAGTTAALTLLSHRLYEFLDAKSGAVRLLTLDFLRRLAKFSMMLFSELPLILRYLINCYVCLVISYSIVSSVFLGITVTPPGLSFPAEFLKAAFLALYCSR